ncbi:MAG: DUF4292 domain-containing protein, partial [Deltaproteobacteria bacterium]|nr:DUF4292 domain-containing protein [Deltaproteobacteria bacterium]
VTAAALLAELKQRQESCSSLRGMARISWREGNRNAVNSRQALLVRRPDRIRLELFGLFGQPVLVAAINSRRVTALDIGEGVFLQGEASPENLYRLLHLPLRPADLARLILNQVPEMKITYPPTLETTPEGCLLLLSGTEREQELHFDGQGRLVKMGLSFRGERQLEAEYGDFSGAEEFPRRMRFYLPFQGMEVTLRFDALETNVRLGDELFELQAPEGFRSLSLP